MRYTFYRGKHLLLMVCIQKDPLVLFKNLERKRKIAYLWKLKKVNNIFIIKNFLMINNDLFIIKLLFISKVLYLKI